MNEQRANAERARTLLWLSGITGPIEDDWPTQVEPPPLPPAPSATATGGPAAARRHAGG